MNGERQREAVEAAGRLRIVEARQIQVLEDWRALVDQPKEEAALKILEWYDLSTLQRHAWAEKVRVQDPPRWLVPTAEDAERALERLTHRWVRRWAEHDWRVRQALRELAAKAGSSIQALKHEHLQAGILLALAEATRPQVTRLGRDRVMRWGSELKLLQKRDLEALASTGRSDQSWEKLRAPAVGLHAFEGHRLVGPIEALLDGHELERVRPTDLRPSAFARWVRRRAIVLAEGEVLDRAGFETGDPHESWQPVDVIDFDRREAGGSSSDAPQVPEIELLTALDRLGEHPLHEVLYGETFAEILGIATSAQQQLVRLIDLLHVSVGLPLDETIKIIAGVQDAAVNSVHQTRGRLRGRLRAAGLSGSSAF